MNPAIPPPPGTVPVFPDAATWLATGEDRLDQVGAGLLAVCYGALALFGRAGGDPDRYDRAYVGHGQTPPVVPKKGGQLTVVLQTVSVGQAGKLQFQYIDGSAGAVAYRVAQFSVTIAGPWPTQQTGAVPGPPSVPAIDQDRGELWRDGWIVWNALLALALGGVSRPWPIMSARGEQVAVGQLQAKDPTGGRAVWETSVQVDL